METVQAKDNEGNNGLVRIKEMGHEQDIRTQAQGWQRNKTVSTESRLRESAPSKH